MKATQRFKLGAGAVVVTLSLGGCAGMSAQDKNTPIGGNILTGGSAIGTVGGAAVGGVIGHEINK